MNFQLSALVLSISSVFAVAVFAEQPNYDSAPKPKQDAASAFAEMDRDGNGAISAGEAEGTWLAEIFTIADLNGDGMVEMAEYTEALS